MGRYGGYYWFCCGSLYDIICASTDVRVVLLAAVHTRNVASKQTPRGVPPLTEGGKAPRRGVYRDTGRFLGKVFRCQHPPGRCQKKFPCPPEGTIRKKTKHFLPPYTRKKNKNSTSARTGIDHAATQQHQLNIYE